MTGGYSRGVVQGRGLTAGGAPGFDAARPSSGAALTVAEVAKHATF